MERRQIFTEYQCFSLLNIMITLYDSLVINSHQQNPTFFTWKSFVTVPKRQVCGVNLQTRDKNTYKYAGQLFESYTYIHEVAKPLKIVI